jgi:hypothetical protein
LSLDDECVSPFPHQILFILTVADEECTETGMVKGIELGWASNKLPENKPEDVGKAIILCATANRGENKGRREGAVTPFAGKILWVSGGESYEIEDNLQRLEPEWLGRENSAVLKRGQEFLMSEGTSWDVGRSKP